MPLQSLFLPIFVWLGFDLIYKKRLKKYLFPRWSIPSSNGIKCKPSGADVGVEPSKLNVKTYNNAWLKKSEPTHLRAIKPLQIAPENAGNHISEALKLKIFRGNTPTDPPTGLLLSVGVYPNPPSSNPGSAPKLSKYMATLLKINIPFPVQESHIQIQIFFPTKTHQ